MKKRSENNSISYRNTQVPASILCRVVENATKAVSARWDLRREFQYTSTLDRMNNLIKFFFIKPQ